MIIQNSTKQDLAKIFDLYRIATDYMKSKNQVHWPEFSKTLILSEINENRQWKLLIDGQIACIWATTLNDELIWGKENNAPAVYLHRIAVDPNFRGQNLVQQVVDWATEYCKRNNLSFIRMDTVGLNKGLIGHYEKLGFVFLGAKMIETTDGLPDHYKDGPVCYFEKIMNG